MLCDMKTVRRAHIRVSAGSGGEPVTLNGRTRVRGSLSLPNGQRIVTVRKDIMDLALKREFAGTE